MSAAALVAASGAIMCQEVLNAVAFNISNAKTIGFKEKFLDVVTVVARGQGGANAGVPANAAGDVETSNVTKGLGVRIQGENVNLNQGNIKNTGGNYDVAIQGRGYFVVNSADGKTYYTRAGNFKKDATGKLVTQKGYSVSPGITIPSNATDVKINDVGEVWATIAGQQAPQNLGVIQIAIFSNPAGLREIGDNLLEQADPNDNPVTGNPGVDGKGTLVQGALEESNVDVVKQLVEAMQANNTYAMLVKIIEADKKQGEQIAAAG